MYIILRPSLSVRVAPRLHPHISPVPADKPEGIAHLITGLLKSTVGRNHTLDVIRMEAVKGAVHIYLIKLFPGHPGYVQKSLADKMGKGIPAPVISMVTRPPGNY